MAVSRIDQHRLVKAAVKSRFDDGTIHALSVKTDVPGLATLWPWPTQS